MDEQREVLLRLTREQSEIISEFLNFNNWDSENIIIRNDWTVENVTDTDSQGEIVTCQEALPQTSIGGENGGGGDHDPSEPSGNGGHNGQCEHCFCTPCVTTFRQAWLGDGARHHMRNSAIRKTKYRKFWKLLSLSHAWNHPRYLEKKRHMLQVNTPQDLGEMYTLREIMPQCVLDVVRELYPNPPSKPYMGHKWN